jgi:uncharacterized protein
MHLQGTRIVVTGAASGIGAATLHALMPGPGGIVAVDRDEPRLHQTIASLNRSGGAITPLVADLGRPEEVDAVFDFAQKTLGGIDIFIANAGFAYYERLAKADWRRMQALLSVNVISPLYAAVKMEEINPGRKHRTVVVASALGQLAIPGYALYSGSKAALHRFAEARRFELSDPTSLTMVYPIGTRTRFFDVSSHRPAPLTWPTQSAEQVARAIVRGIERDQKDIYPSALFRMVLIADRFLPFVRRIEQYIENRRFRRWLKG